MSTQKIRVIFHRDGEAWIAQGLERDICVQADRLEDLYGLFEVAVRLEDAEPGGLERIGQAPQHYYDMWERRSGDFTPNNASDSCYEVGLAA